MIVEKGKGHVTISCRDGACAKRFVEFELRFDPAHPAAVALVVEDEPWVFDRSLLHETARPLNLSGGEGYRSVGEGDVRIERTLGGVAIAVSSPEGSARIVFPAQHATEFMRAVDDLVPDEQIAYDVDAWLAEGLA